MGEVEPRAAGRQAKALPAVTYSLLFGRRGPKEAPGKL